MIRVLKRLKEDVRDKPVDKRRRTKLRLRRAEILALKREADRRVVNENRSSSTVPWMIAIAKHDCQKLACAVLEKHAENAKRAPGQPKASGTAET